MAELLLDLLGLGAKAAVRRIEDQSVFRRPIAREVDELPLGPDALGSSLDRRELLLQGGHALVFGHGGSSSAATLAAVELDCHPQTELHAAAVGGLDLLGF